MIVAIMRAWYTVRRVQLMRKAQTLLGGMGGQIQRRPGRVWA